MTEYLIKHPLSSYATGCRCETCREYQRARVKANRQRRLAEGLLSHGTRSAYDAGCRCPDCRAARHAAYVRLHEYRRQRSAS